MIQPVLQPGQYPSTTPMPAIGEARPSTGTLFVSVTGQISGIIRNEAELNKAKLRVSTPKNGKGIGLLVVAAVFALYLLGWVFHAIEVALKLVAPAWAASLVVIDTLLLTVLTLALVGISSLKSVQTHRPDPAALVVTTKEAIGKGLGK